MLRCLIHHNNRNQDTLILQIQFACPFEIVHGYRSTKPLDLVPLSPHVRVSEFVETFAQHIHDLHHDILKTLHDNYHQYTLHADLHERFKEFNVGDHVMVRIKLECLPSGLLTNCRPIVLVRSKLLNVLAQILTFLTYHPTMPLHSTLRTSLLIIHHYPSPRA